MQTFNICIIDDALALCRDLRTWLEELGHRVFCYPTGWPSLNDLISQETHLIVFGLTGSDDRSLAGFRKLEAHRQLRQVPIIVVGNNPDLEYEMLDVLDVQTLPLDRERFRNSLERLARSGSQNATLMAIDPNHLEPFRTLLAESCGLHFSRHNQRLLERGLLRRIQALKMDSAESYGCYLSRTAEENHDELNKLLGLLTVGETCFFRYRAHREALQSKVLPELIDHNRSLRRLRIWSAGCSTGEEPYSLAIMIREHFPELVDWDVQILATDINKRALRLAREGIYGERSLRMVEAGLRTRYFRRQGAFFQVAPQIRHLVRFEYHNLRVEPPSFSGGGDRAVDLLLCRNVLIYFDVETIRQIISRFSAILGPKGFLFLGHAETLQNISDRFLRCQQQGAFFYQLKGAQVDAGQKKAPRRPAPPLRAASAAPPALPRDVEPPANTFRAAMAAFEKEQFKEAGKLLDALLEKQPEHARALVAKGLLLANLGRYDEARILCARAIRSNDLLPEAYLLRGLIHDMEGRLERALVEYQKVLWLDPLFIMAYYLTAKACGALGRPDQQRRALRNTLRCLEQTRVEGAVPFSGGLSRAVFMEIVRKEMATL